jgi:hypothetical protein
MSIPIDEDRNHLAGFQTHVQRRLTIAVALFQAADFASHFSTVGYLVGITSILSIVKVSRQQCKHANI